MNVSFQSTIPTGKKIPALSGNTDGIKDPVCFYERAVKIRP
jgi:hypothetical protein